MQLDRLLSRIRAALQDYASEFEQRALAAEYAELCAKASLRLEQMVPLIRSEQDYAALQIAEAPPPVLDLVRQLSFAEVESWRAFCQRRGLPVAQPFDERNVDLVNQLYGKKISETHPLYRDYRQAIRLRQEQQALRVLQSIRRVNPDDANAQAEYTRLAHKLHLRKNLELAAALDQADAPRALALMESIEADGSVGNDFDPVWQRAVALREAHELAAARQRCLEIAAQLSTLRESGQWEETLPLLADWDSLHNQFKLTLEPGVETASADIRQWAAALLAARQHEEACQRHWQTLATRLDEISAQKPRTLASKTLAAHIDELQDFVAGLADNHGEPPPGLVEQLHAQLAALRALARRRRLTRITLTAAAVIIVGSTIAVLAWRHAREQQLLAQSNNLKVLLAQQAYAPLAAAVQTIDTKYPDLSNDPAVSGLLAQAHAFLASQAAVRASFQTELAQLDKTAAGPVTPAQLSALLDSLATLGHRIDGLGAESSADLRAELADRRVRWTQILTHTQEERTAKLTDIASRADQLFTEKLTQPAPAETIAAATQQIHAILDEADLVPPDPDHATPAEQAARARLADQLTKLGTLVAAASDAIAARAELAQARTFDEYRAPLERLAANPLAGDPTVAAAHALFAHPPDWNAVAQSILLPGDPKGWAFLANSTDVRLQPATSAQTEDIAFSRLVTNDVLGNTYRANLVEYQDGAPHSSKPVFLAGPLTEENNKWDKNTEVLQTAKVINPDGTVTDTDARLISFDGQSPRGNSFTDAKLAPESRLVGRLHQAYDARSGGIREPLLRVLDDVRADPAASPILKAYLQQEILKIMQNRPDDWGLAFAPTALADARALTRLTGGNLQPADWLFPADPHLVDNLRIFYASTADHHYYDEATTTMQNLLRLRATPILFAGYVDLSAKAALATPPAAATNLWGLDTSGAWNVLYHFQNGQPAPAPDQPTPARLTPLLYTRSASTPATSN